MNNTLGMIGLGNAGSALASALSGRIPLVGYDADSKRRDADLWELKHRIAAVNIVGLIMIIQGLGTEEGAID